MPGALRCFDQADEYLAALDGADGMGLIDRSEVELGARLVTEARRSAQAAVDTLADQGEEAYLAIARLRLAQAALVEGDAATARTVADDGPGRLHRPAAAGLGCARPPVSRPGGLAGG